jgi:tRNA threonylcarbamoyladenosine biosynthesis protein TsaE
MEWQASLDTLPFLAKTILETYPDRTVFALHGEMGAGKTTLTHAICDYLGVSSTVSSPTYAIIHEYRYGHQYLFHMDWYRLKDMEEAIQAGVEDALYSGQICLVEWPERASALLPADTVHLYLTIIDSQTRLLKTA